MTLRELGKKLEEMYYNAPKGEKVTMIHFFGIKYRDEIAQYGIREVIDESGIRTTYKTELNKAVKLAKYVNVKSV